VVNYLLTMALNINAYAIVEAANEEEAKKKGTDLKLIVIYRPWIIMER
jgi:hypothetical protein